MWSLSSLTKEETDILIGSLLGDGCLRMMGRATKPAFSVSHGEKEKQYVFWKYDRIKRFVRTPPWREVRIYHKDRSRRLASWRFQTLTNDAFYRLYKSFYPHDKKVIPDSIVSLLNGRPLSLAVWLMDDGNKNHNAVFLNTQSFSFPEQKRLASALAEIYEFHVTLNKHSISNGKQLYRIRIDTLSTRKLSEIVRAYILPEFRYKIPHLSP